MLLTRVVVQRSFGVLLGVCCVVLYLCRYRVQVYLCRYRVQASACADVLTPDPSDKRASHPEFWKLPRSFSLSRYCGIIVDSILNI